MELIENIEQSEKFKKGRIGEQIIVNNINSNIDIYKKIIRNVILYEENKSTEVDIILITCVGIFVIESKNFNGYIFGNYKDKKWTQILTKNNHNIFDNPILQNQYHIEFIMKNLNLDISYFRSYVVFGDNTKLQDITLDGSDNVKVINNKDLIENIMLDIHNGTISLSHEEIDKMYIDLKYFYSHNIY